MRILHTSDWHLGRSFHREGLLGAQASFVDHLVETVASEGVDAVVISGDVYDRALPSVDAVAVANDSLKRMIAVGARVIITSGNHDSAQRLGFAADLIDAAGVHLRTSPAGVGTPVVLDDAYGSVAVYGIPYLEPDLVRTTWDLDQRSHQAVLDEAMRRVRGDLAGRSTSRSVVMAHAFVTGAAASQSERDITVGGVANVGIDTFAGVDYAALGHLHGRHTLADSVRYSGSPLAYSFSEVHHRKGSWLVELGPEGFERADFVEAPVPRRVATIRGTLESLLTAAAHAEAESSWVQATITDPQRPRHAMDRLRARFPHTLVLAFEPEGGTTSSTVAMRDRVVGLSDAEIFANFFADVRGSKPDEAEAQLLQAACDSCRVSADSAS
ncbi:MAG: exonuclease SbcCD subunit D [Nocardioidaceae bacterium]